MHVHPAGSPQRRYLATKPGFPAATLTAFGVHDAQLLYAARHDHAFYGAVTPAFAAGLRIEELDPSRLSPSVAAFFEHENHTAPARSFEV